MMWDIPNEMLLVFHIIIVTSCTLAALRMGKEALTVTICLFGIFANLLVTKQITLFGLDAISTDVYAVGCFVGLSLMQEYFGKAAAQKTITINMYMLLLYIFMGQFVLWYTPNSFDTMHAHFTNVFSSMPRIVGASILVYYLTQLLSVFLYSIGTRLYGQRHLATRTFITLSTSQLFDTVLFGFAALYGIVHSVWHVILISYSIKMLVIIGSSPFVRLSRLIVKQD